MVRKHNYRSQIQHTTLTLALLLAGLISAQAEALTPLHSFTPGFESAIVPGSLGPDTVGTAYAMVLAPDGKYYLGGDFVISRISTRLNVARFHPDGTLDETFKPATIHDGVVRAMELQEDGKLLIAGDFTRVGGLDRGHIARLDENGAVDLTFDPGFGFDATVWALELQPDGSIFAAGDFNVFDGSARRRVARLNPDGSLESTFDPGTGPQSTVHSIAVQSDGKVIVGTTYNAYLGTTRNGIYRLNTNGTLDASFDPPSNGFGSFSTVETLILQPDGKIIAAGSLSSYGGTPRTGVARLNPDASLDLTFNPATEGVFTGNNVAAVQLLPSGKILVAGGADGDSGRPGIALLNANGSLDSIFNPGTGFDGSNPSFGQPGTSEGSVFALAAQPDGRFLAAGDFLMFANMPVQGVVRITSDGSPDFPFLPTALRVPGAISAAAALPDGKLVVGGAFTHIKGVERVNIAVLNSDGTPASGIVPSFGDLQDVAVNAVAVQADGSFLIGGEFSFGYGFLTRFTPSGMTETNYNAPNGRLYSVSSLLVQPDGKLLVNGTYRYHADASPDTSFSAEFSGALGASEMALQPDGKIIVTGEFTEVNGASRNHIGRLNSDGTLDTTFDPGTGFNSDVTALVLQPDGKIIVGGDFTGFNGAGRNRIARLNADGSLDTSFSVGSGFNNEVHSLLLQADGKVVAAGPFSSFSGTPRRYFARLNSDGSLDESFLVPTVVIRSAEPSIPVLIDAAGDALYAGGSWLLFENQIGGGLIQLGLPPSAVLQGLMVSSGGISIDLSGPPGASETIQRATSVEGPWSDVITIVIESNGTGHFEDPNPPSESAYYRSAQE